jgi:hypothetical protein
MLKCSMTGQEFSTSIEIEQDSFRELPDVVTRAYCPHCGQMHSMFTRDTRWAEGMLQLSWKIAARHQASQGIFSVAHDAARDRSGHRTSRTALGLGEPGRNRIRSRPREAL